MSGNEVNEINEVNKVEVPPCPFELPVRAEGHCLYEANGKLAMVLRPGVADWLERVINNHVEVAELTARLERRFAGPAAVDKGSYLVPPGTYVVEKPITIDEVIARRGRA